MEAKRCTRSICAPRKRQKLRRSATKMMTNQTTNSDDDTIM
jgi:hypothetical protein